MHPIQFTPILKLALWGGNRLEKELAKNANGAQDAAESWEVSDLPGNVSIVSGGEFAGTTLRQLMQAHRAELLGRHSSLTQFPLLVKFLDANQQLSVQVHPKDPTLMSDGTFRSGKAECWIVLEASAESKMYVGLLPGVSEQDLRNAVKTGEFENCLNAYQPRPGDCLYLRPGTVHALGGGLLIAEIQQPSDITYRFYDWGRTDSQGRPRELHVEQSFAATNFDIGPVFPVTPRPLAERPGSELLVECPHFVINRHRGVHDLILPDDDKMHVLVVLAGSISQSGLQLVKGQTVVVPAARTLADWKLSEDAIVLDSYLPD